MEPTSRDVSFLGSLLKINSLCNNFQAHQFNKYSGGIGVTPNTMGYFSLPPRNQGDHEDTKKKPRKSRSPTHSLSSPPSPITPQKSTDRHAAEPSLDEEVDDLRSLKDHPARVSPSSNNSTPRLAKTVLAQPQSPKIGRNFNRCRCSPLPADVELLERRPHPARERRVGSPKLISNIYYLRPPALIEYRKREMSTSSSSSPCDQITDELIDLTQSTISMVQSLKRELRN